MAKTIRSKLDGILNFWKHDKITNASQEGFNNKIGWLTRQAYSYRDKDYLTLKIFDLPNLSQKRDYKKQKSEEPIFFVFNFGRV